MAAKKPSQTSTPTAPQEAMPGEKAVAASAAIWDVLDSNHDGVLDSADREARQVRDFARIDENGDGELSQSELGTGSREFGAEQTERRNAWFVRLDADRSGGLTRAEIAGGADDPGQKERAARGERLFSMADTSKDRRVSRREYDAAVGRFLKEIDSNGDGVISVAEREAGGAALRRMTGSDVIGR